MNVNFLYSLSKSRKSSTFTFILRVFQNEDILPGNKSYITRLKKWAGGMNPIVNITDYGSVINIGGRVVVI